MPPFLLAWMHARYLMPYVFRGGLDDGLLAVTEGILRSTINLAKMVQSAT